MSEGKLKNCHVEEGRSPDVNISAYCHTEERSDVAISAYCHPSFSQENVKGSSNYKTIKSGRSLDLAFQLGAMTMISLFSFNAYATCTPTPDCASIGYTETSCETISLKCPFDQTKLYCFPCDSAYQYTCSNTNEYGNGNSCNNKYKSCCNTDCVVGNIYYSDGTCNSCLDANKTPVGVVVKDNELVISQIRSTGMEWSSNYVKVSGITETSDREVAKQDFNGKANTLAIIATFTSDTVDNNAAINCNSYSTAGTNAGDWYLPAAGELYSYVYGNWSSKLKATATKLSWSLSTYFWSSSEGSDNLAWFVHSYHGYVSYDDKGDDYSVSCFLAIN